MNKTKSQSCGQTGGSVAGGCIFALMQYLKAMPDAEYLQYLIAYHAAPTLENIKPATLICPDARGRDIGAAMAECAPRLRDEFGVELAGLRNRSGALLALIYRPLLLRSVLAAGDAALLLAESGYEVPADGMACLLERLAEKCASRRFPHEIGVFLGYPPGDVRRFMLAGGRGAVGAGCWKAWDDVHRVDALSARYRAAKLRAAELIVKGASLREIAGEFKN